MLFLYIIFNQENVITVIGTCNGPTDFLKVGSGICTVDYSMLA